MVLFPACFNPRTYIRYDFLPSCTVTFSLQFQSTYLYKVRRLRHRLGRRLNSFNPRTYIRYDIQGLFTGLGIDEFQSTYLYKVRLRLMPWLLVPLWFQSTYLYKVRLAIKQKRIIASVSIHVPI